MPARDFLCRLVNRWLQGRVSPRLDPDKPPSKVKIKSNLPVLASLNLMPVSLLAACWFRLAQAISGQREERLCPKCGKWFVVEPGDRSDKKFCKETCRKLFYQQNRDTARRLRGQGKTAKAIAAELGVDLEMVKKWVSIKEK